MEQDIIAGLSLTPKSLPSKYFYDRKGDALFQAIMDMPEYYLTRSEYEIMTQQSSAIAEALNANGYFEVMELGAGDGTKTKVLLSNWLKRGLDFTYTPVDISANVLNQLQASFKTQLPELSVTPMQGEYFDVLEKTKSQQHKRLILFMGSNIGNFRGSSQNAFIDAISANMNPGDGLLVGFDLVKDPRIILEAYNDKQGITKAFNMNVLERCNKVLNTNFSLEEFAHYPIYDPHTQEARSYLISKRRQSVHFPNANVRIDFDAGETIHTETSRKYTEANIKALYERAQLKVNGWFYDCKHYFVDCLGVK